MSGAISARDAGYLGSRQITLEGFWSDRTIMHSCAMPNGTPGELEIYCHDREYGIVEADEPIGELTRDFRFLPTDSPNLTPWLSDDLWRRLYQELRPDIPNPPVPIVLIGHFDDRRATDCRPEARETCRDRFVVDEIVLFDPSSVPPPTPTPSPTPFPSPAPPAPFGPDRCPGDDDYEFVGWTTTDRFGLDIHPDGHIFAMVTEKIIPVGGWIKLPPDATQASRQWGQRVCYTTDIEAEFHPETPVIMFTIVPGTGFREYEDGTRLAGDR